jgi:hypothetical protein
MLIEVGTVMAENQWATADQPMRFIKKESNMSTFEQSWI